MNIVEVIRKLRSSNLLSGNEDDMSVFSDSFSKFGISILKLNDLDKFKAIVDLLAANNIPIKKSNGSYFLRVFSLSYNDLSNIIEDFKKLDELDFLRNNISYITRSYDIIKIRDNMVIYKNNGVDYKNNSNYNLELLLKEDAQSEIKDPISGNLVNESTIDIPTENADIPLNEYLKRYLDDADLIAKLDAKVANDGEINVDLDLTLQKVENKVCEEYLFPIDDGWKIVINKVEINPFQNAKNTIDGLIRLNKPVSYSDALLLVLFYNANVSKDVVDNIVNSSLFREDV